MSEIEPVIGWSAHCDEIMSLLSLDQLEASNLKAEVASLEAENGNLRKALEPFAEAGSMAIISGRPPGEHVDASKFIEARAALDGLAAREVEK